MMQIEWNKVFINGTNTHYEGIIQDNGFWV